MKSISVMPNVVGSRDLRFREVDHELASTLEDIVVGVVALQGAFSAHEAILQSLGVLTRQVRLPSDLTGLSGVVLPGGESTTMSNLLQSSELFEPLSCAIRSGLPTLGTCAGMILLADRIRAGRADQVSFHALDITVRRNGYGRQVDSFETEIHVKESDRSFHGVFIRAPIIESTGPQVEVLAYQGEDPCLVRQGHVLAASFHPELTNDPTIHQKFLDIVHSVRRTSS